MAFDPKDYIIKVQGGKEYLPVAARLVWFRQDHPNWGIVTDPLEINYEKQFAVFRATILSDSGSIIATATKREDVRGFADWLEKAETGSVGRALAMCGYGTQFTNEFDEGTDRVTDAPQPQRRPTFSEMARSANPNSPPAAPKFVFSKEAKAARDDFQEAVVAAGHNIFNDGGGIDVAKVKALVAACGFATDNETLNDPTVWNRAAELVDGLPADTSAPTNEGGVPSGN